MLQVALSLFVFLTLWWLFIKPLSGGVLVSFKHFWSSVYVAMPLLGGIYGFVISKAFGGRKSVLGKMILAFSLGLFLQAFGQIIYTYYLWSLQIEAPYPSLGDMGYFGSIFAYIYGIFILARYIGVTISFRSFLNKIPTIVIPFIMLTFSYFTFLKGYKFDFSNFLKIFLDFGYPIFQAFYVSLALLVLFFSKKSLGGVLRKPVLLLVFALIIQYISDSYFIYTANNGTWYLGGIGDYFYLVSYFAMTLVIIYIGDTFEKIRLESSKIKTAYSETDADNDLEKLFNQILTEIIKRQVRIAGPLGWQEVRKVASVSIINEESVVVSMVGDPKKTIDELIYRYKNFFGDIAVKVSKNAAYHLIMKLPPEEVPDSLR